MSASSGAIARASMALVIAFVANMFVAASPAQAASCVGNECNGKDPNSYCASGATTLKSFLYHEPVYYDSAGWEERYNSTCKAVWVRLTVTSGSGYVDTPKVRGRIESRVGTSETVVREYTPVLELTGLRQSKTDWSAMVSRGTGKQNRMCWNYTRPESDTWNGWDCSAWS